MNKRQRKKFTKKKYRKLVVRIIPRKVIQKIMDELSLLGYK